ncbi:NF038130 family PEP-CTERM protein [Spirulina subsalsa FACHB-351]|uniref:NF038130 family PEP-CTERM protein n=1 Tax=Spirulina subsalsa FACHB-351 TaxID=234711 RepID=A0ABT3L2J7_9CYAN|nr:NF038130 family PEP-CTERM protein [Spirulina subsalsa]MCW6035737.1 NF038130 family PEP-CTERM protein [Spirulina subsalsa FACHB-351]
MKGTIKSLLISASMAVGMSAIATSSALAATLNLTNVQLFGDDYLVYGADDAITALTDTDRYSHIELNAADENLSTNTTGFTGNLGSTLVKVEGINADDWSGGLGAQWLSDFTAAYPAIAGASFMGMNLGSMIADTAATVIGRAGDPNISYMAKDSTTGVIEMDLIGHHNIWNAPWLQLAINEQVQIMSAQTGMPVWMVAMGVNSLMTQLKQAVPLLQISEIAKVTIDGKVSYAYGFSAVETGVLAADAGVGDSSSHTGRYTIALQGTPEKDRADVPEPSLMIGLALVGGAVVASKRKS